MTTTAEDLLWKPAWEPAQCGKSRCNTLADLKNQDNFMRPSIFYPVLLAE